MKKKITKLLSIALSFTILFSVVPQNVFAADDESYVAFGDSIPAGYGLNAGEENFVTLLGGQTGVEATNHGISGQTAAQLETKMVTNGEYDADIIDADYITITIGGNDLMAVFYGLVATSYNATIADSTGHIEASQVAGILAGPDGDMKAAVLNSAGAVIFNGYTGETQTGFQAKSAEVKNDIQAMVDYIRGKNPNVKIYVTNQYNPYKGIFLVGDFFESGLSDFNSAISSLAGCKVIDIHGDFNAANITPGTVTNATDTSNLDFHPNADGHALYATALENLISLEALTGTVEIQGTPQYGENLRGVGYSLNDLANISQQWKRNGVDIAGATSNEYALTKDDIGASITFEITANGASDKSGTITSPAVIVEKAEKASPAAPSQDLVMHNAIIVSTEPGQEYRINGGEWQASGTFAGLTPETKYEVTTRAKETDTHKTSSESAPLVLTTEKAPALSYTQSATKGENKDVAFTIEGKDLMEFGELRLMGELVDPVNYTTASGSIIVTLKGGYVSTLPVGTHTFTAMLETEMVDLNLQVVATGETTPESVPTDAPQTGDNTNVALLVGLMIISLAGVGVAIYRKKENN